jgi:hypothetical protein
VACAISLLISEDNEWHQYGLGNKNAKLNVRLRYGVAMLCHAQRPQNAPP